MNYRILLLGLTILFSIQAGWAQTTNKEQRKIEKAERKRLKEEARQRNQELIMDLVQDQTYVLEANTLTNRYNQQFPVSPTTNFVKVEGNRVTIQTANNLRIGYNGLGGVTINGTIQDYQVYKERNGVSVSIQFTDPVLGHSTLQMRVPGDGFAQAMVSSNWGRRITFQGQFVAPEQARVFKGQGII